MEELQSADHLIKHVTDNGQVIVIECEVRGENTRDRRSLRQSVLLNYHLGESPHCTLERLHGLLRRLEGADSGLSFLSGTFSLTSRL